ncbi:MAG: acetate--CoA ligase family protein [Micromonosporaceae bacterium]
MPVALDRMLMPAPIDRMLRPRSIAVVGASNNPSKRGYHAVRELLSSGYPHPVYPVNPCETEVLGLRAYPAVSAIAAPVDLAFIATPAHTLPDVLADCGRAGVAGAVAVAVGFAETGEEGRRRQEQVLAAARRYGVRLIGPNTSGFFNLPEAVNLVGVPEVPPGPLGLVSQSGTILLSVLEAARRAGGTGLSLYVGVGNESDVGYPELVDHLGDAPHIRAICLHAEGFRRGRETLAAITRAAVRKPVVVLKAGRTRDGVRSARSHTGAVAGDAAVAAAALRTAGATWVDREDELLPVAAALAGWPTPPGGRTAVLADGGGHATIAADAIGSSRHLRLAHLAEKTRARLRDLLGPHASVANPVDVAGATDTDPVRFADAAAIVLDDDGVDQLVVVGLLGGYAKRFDPGLRDSEQEAATVLAQRARGPKPVLVCSVYAGGDNKVLAPLFEAGVPVHPSVELTVRAADALAERAAWLRGERPSWPSLPSPPPGRPRLLTEPQARELLRLGGVPVGPHRLARTADEAAAAATALGGRVALKVVSPDIAHKSDVGGVRLDVTPLTAAAAYTGMLAEVAARCPHARIDGVLVTPMVREPGVEMLVGVSYDETFGPVLTVGAGGTLVELLGDVSSRPLPVTPDLARRMLGDLVVRRLLAGYRGTPPADVEALVSLMVAVSEFAVAHPEVRELDLNPVLVHAGGVAVLDARIIAVPASPQPPTPPAGR